MAAAANRWQGEQNGNGSQGMRRPLRALIPPRSTQVRAINSTLGLPLSLALSLKHLIADTSLGLEMSMGLVAAAAAAVGADAPDGAELAHAAKAFVAEQGVELAHNCFQVYGGIGYTWEHDQHLYLRRLAADASSFGSARWHRAQLLDVAGVAS